MKNPEQKIKELHEQLRHTKTPHILIADVGGHYVLNAAVGNNNLDLSAALFTAKILFRLEGDENMEMFGELTKLFAKYGTAEEIDTLRDIAMSSLANRSLDDKLEIH